MCIISAAKLRYTNAVYASVCRLVSYEVVPGCIPGPHYPPQTAYRFFSPLKVATRAQ